MAKAKERIIFKKYSDEIDLFKQFYDEVRTKHFAIIQETIDEISKFEDQKSCVLYANVNDEFYLSNLNLPSKNLLSEHPKIAHASSSVAIRPIEGKGNGLEAVKYMKEGEKIIVEKATVLQVNPLCMCEATSDSLYRCHHCAAATKSYFTCYNCSIVIYCSHTCQKADYSIYHKYECFGLQYHFWSMKPTDPSYLAMKMMLYGAQHEFKTTPANEDCHGDKKNPYSAVFKLRHNLELLSVTETTDILNASLRTLVYLIEKTTFFQDLNKRKPIDDIVEMHSFIGGLLFLHHLQATNSNLLINFPNINCGKHFNCDSNRGKGIFPTASLVNHSCTPNACFVFNNHTVILRALKPIKVNEEITVCYYEVSPAFSYFDRQIVLQTFFKFSCSCSRCTYEAPMDLSYFKCKYCKGRTYLLQKDILICMDCDSKMYLKELSQDIKQTQVLFDLYKRTGELKYIKRLCQLYDEIYHPYSPIALTGALLLCDKYMYLYLYHDETDDPITVLTCFMKNFAKFEEIYPRYSKFFIAGKIQFFYRFLKHTESEDQFKLKSKEQHDAVRHFMALVESLERELRFYLPKHKLGFCNILLYRARKFHSLLRRSRHL